MKLADDLKKKAETAASRGEAKRAIEGAGKLLTDDELDAVSGGSEASGEQTPDGIIRSCPECGEFALQIPVMGGQYKCDACHRVYMPSLCAITGRIR